MTTNSAIQKACNDILIAAALGYPIAWPGISFTPPTSGYWLVVTHLPNRGVDDRLANDSHVSPQGIYQVTVNSRPTSEINLREVAESVMAVFPKGTPIIPPLRVTDPPYDRGVMYLEDRMELVVTVEYSE